MASSRGVILFCCDSASRSAPRATRTRMVASSALPTASKSGVTLPLSRVLTSAPLSSSDSTARVRPCSVAQASAVLPPRSLASSFAPWEIRASITSTWPPAAASIRAVRAIESLARRLAIGPVVQQGLDHVRIADPSGVQQGAPACGALQVRVLVLGQYLPDPAARRRAPPPWRNPAAARPRLSRRGSEQEPGGRTGSRGFAWQSSLLNLKVT